MKKQILYIPNQRRKSWLLKNAYYLKEPRRLSTDDVRPGALDVLKQLKEKGVKVAVKSASRTASEMLERTELMPYIDEIICGLDVKKSKPDPGAFLAAADKLSVAYENCLLVVDSTVEIEAAKIGGMFVLTLGKAKGNALADYKANSLADEDVKRILGL